MRMRALLLATTLLSLPVSAAAAPFSALYVFGDSLSDTGNFAAIAAATGFGTVPAPPYAPGVASNGPIAVQHLAAALGLSAAPFAAGGTNYAVIGAATGPVAFPGIPGGADNVAQTLGFPLPPTGILSGQLPAFFSQPLPADIGDALFFLWDGANDLAITAASGSPDPTVPLQAAANIGTAISILYGAGARNFMVPDLPDGGLTPGAINPALGTAATLAFNQALAFELAARMALPGIQITTFDTFGLFNQVVSNPAVYGFSNVSDPCYVGPLLAYPFAGPACLDDDAYLFWDASGHPTARAHALLGQQFADALEQPTDVPEPTLLTLALVGVAATVRRRRAA